MISDFKLFVSEEVGDRTMLDLTLKQDMSTRTKSSKIFCLCQIVVFIGGI